MWRCVSLSLLGGLCLYGCSLDASLKLTAQEAKSDYQHAESGMIFPVTVDGFRRDGMFRIDDGKILGAGYKLMAASWPVTVRVEVIQMPSHFSKIDSRITDTVQLCEAEIAVNTDTMSRYAPHIVRHERQIGSPPNHPSAFGWVSSHQDELSLDDKRQPVNETDYSFCPIGGKWMIKYSFVWPIGQDASTIAEDFVRHLPWTIK